MAYRFCISAIIVILASANFHMAFAFPTIKTSAQWTVMIYIDGRGDLEEAAKCTLSQLLRLPKSTQVSIVVQLAFDSSPGPMQEAVTQARASCDFNQQQSIIPYWHGVRRFTLNSANRFPGSSVNEEMSSKEALSRFVKWTLRHQQARHYMLIFSSHGEGVPFLLEIQNAWLAMPAAALELLPAVQSFLRASHAHQDTVLGLVGGNGRLLSNADIKAALDIALRGKQIDIIGFDACYKAMLETAYAMRNNAKLLIGSEASEPSYGWNYNDWLRLVLNNPHTKADQIARIIVESYRMTAQIDTIPSVTLSITDLADLESLINTLDKLAGYLDGSPDLWSLVNAARTETFAFDLHEVDIGRLMERIRAKDLSNRLQEETRDVDFGLDKAILYHMGNQSADIYGSNGLAFYFPACADEYQHDPAHENYDPRSGTALPFVKKHQWAKFLLHYLNSSAAKCN